MYKHFEQDPKGEEEIVKALDICYSTPCCTNECPYFNKSGRNFCVENKALYKDMKRILQEHAEQKAEIERLTEERNKYKDLYETMYRKFSDLQDKEFNFEALRKEKTEYFDKAVELQKQVDELKERLRLAYEECECEGDYDTELENLFEQCKKDREQAVKDTAKEIYGLAVVYYDGNSIDSMFFNELEERYGVEVE